MLRAAQVLPGLVDAEHALPQTADNPTTPGATIVDASAHACSPHSVERMSKPGLERGIQRNAFGPQASPWPSPCACAAPALGST